MTFLLRKSRPGRYWKGRINSGTVPGGTSDTPLHYLEPEEVDTEEPLVNGFPASYGPVLMEAAVAVEDPVEAETPAGPEASPVVEDPVTMDAPGVERFAAPLAFTPLNIEQLVADELPAATEPPIVDEPSVPQPVTDDWPALPDGPTGKAAVLANDNPPQPMDDGKGTQTSEPSPVADPLPPHPRAVGAPLPRGKASRPASTSFEVKMPLPRRRSPAPPAAPPEQTRPEQARPDQAHRDQALPDQAHTDQAQTDQEEEHHSGATRAAKAFRAAVPFVQRLLPLLEGNLVGAVTNVLSAPSKPAPPVNFAPVEKALADLQIQHRELSDQIAEQNTSIRRVEDRLEMVREATDRNTLEQQEMMEDLRTVGTKANVVALVALALLLISLFLNLFLYLHIERVFP